MLQTGDGEPVTCRAAREHQDQRVVRRLPKQRLKRRAIDDELRFTFEEAVRQIHLPRVEERDDLIDGCGQTLSGCQRAPSCRMNRVSSGTSQPGIAGQSGSPGSISMNSVSVFRNPGITRTTGRLRAHTIASSTEDRLASCRIDVQVGGGSSICLRSKRAIASCGESHSSAVVSLSSCLACWPAGMRATKKRVSYRRVSTSGVTQCANGWRSLTVRYTFASSCSSRTAAIR